MFHSRPATKKEFSTTVLFISNWWSWLLQIYSKYTEITTIFSIFSLGAWQKKNPQYHPQNSSAFAQGAEIGWALEERVFSSCVCTKGSGLGNGDRRDKVSITKQLMLENLYNRNSCLPINAQVIFPPLIIILHYMLLTILRVSILQY